MVSEQLTLIELDVNNSQILPWVSLGLSSVLVIESLSLPWWTREQLGELIWFLLLLLALVLDQTHGAL